jgi:outer membrane protein OmpA-like peptidoglycan-associated protein
MAAALLLVSSAASFSQTDEAHIVTSEAIRDALARDLVLSNKVNVDEEGYATAEGSPHISLTTVLFELDSSELLDDSKKQLDQVAEALIGLGMSRDLVLSKEKPAEQKILIEGHTCDLGSADHNLELSHARAESVKRYLVSKGVKEQILDPQGIGEARPVVTNTNELNRQYNRRVDFVRLFHESALEEQGVEVSRGLFKRKSFEVLFSAKRASGEVISTEDTLPELANGDKFRFDFNVKRGCYLYALVLNSSRSVAWLHPSEYIEQGLWSYPGERQYIPGPEADRWFTLSPPAGAEIVVMIATSSPIPDVEAAERVLGVEGKKITAKKLKKGAGIDAVQVEVNLITHR